MQAEGQQAKRRLRGLEPEQEYRRGRDQACDELQREHVERLTWIAREPDDREQGDNGKLRDHEQLPEVCGHALIGFWGGADGDGGRGETAAACFAATSLITGVSIGTWIDQRARRRISPARQEVGFARRE